MKRVRAKDVARSVRGAGRVFWIDHAEIVEDDLEWLRAAMRLTLWNVKVPPGFLARLRELWWLDLRGGSAADLEIVQGATSLQYLQVNQVRGLVDLSAMTDLSNLRLLSLYGLLRVQRLPSCAPLTHLQRAEIGQMRGLDSLAGLLDAPGLRELHLSKRVTVTDQDIARIKQHPSMQQFGWWGEDVPMAQWQRVVDGVGLPPVQIMQPDAWFAYHAT